MRHVDAHLARLAQSLAMLAMLRGCCPDHTVDAQLHEGIYVELDHGTTSLDELEVVTSRDRRGSV